ncbi:hypothetical protein [Nocardia sp. CNY236]|uniref:hypothetical protein n=1 Tax=Nocardia sp. CNY236 TaxID=1169152 RepID=UPI0004051A98|nr:hypothetical protein [Nocardia sp. CNY236]
MPESENTDSANSTATRRGPSYVLLVVGVLVLAVSVWAFAGPESWPAADTVPVGWIVVLAAVVGLTLVISPRRRR